RSVACALRRPLLPCHAEALLAVHLGRLAARILLLLALPLLELLLHRLDLAERIVAERLGAAGPVALPAVGVVVAVLRLVEELERVRAEREALLRVHVVRAAARERHESCSERESAEPEGRPGGLEERAAGAHVPDPPSLLVITVLRGDGGFLRRLE